MSQLLLVALTLLQAGGATASNEPLLEAARTGNAAQVTAALDTGADVNAKARYDVTPPTLPPPTDSRSSNCSWHAVRM